LFAYLRTLVEASPERIASENSRTAIQSFEAPSIPSDIYDQRTNTKPSSSRAVVEGSPSLAWSLAELETSTYARPSPDLESNDLPKAEDAQRGVCLSNSNKSEHMALVKKKKALSSFVIILSSSESKDSRHNTLPRVHLSNDSESEHIALG
jgi:hypothetical protein